MEKNQICLLEFDSSDSEPGCFVNFHVDFHPVRDFKFDRVQWKSYKYLMILACMMCYHDNEFWFQVTQKQQHSTSLMNTLSQNIYPHVYQYMNNSVLSMDILPLLVDIIIQSNMRPVSIQQHITIIDEGGGILNTHVSTSPF